jgi:hypothetical protein
MNRMSKRMSRMSKRMSRMSKRMSGISRMSKRISRISKRISRRISKRISSRMNKILLFRVLVDNLLERGRTLGLRYLEWVDQSSSRELPQLLIVSADQPIE